MRCILFDLDGTILDSEKLTAEANRFAIRAVLGREATPEELEQFYGKPAPKVMSKLFPEHGFRILEKGAQYYNEHCHRIVCYDGMEELLTGLHRTGYSLGIVSSKPRKYIVRELESNSLLHFFKCIVGQEDTTEYKPHPAPLLLAAERMGLAPAQCVYVGDQPADLSAARQAGMKSAAALWGEGKWERLSPFSPSFAFATPQAMLEFFVSAKGCRHQNSFKGPDEKAEPASRSDVARA